MHRGTGDYSGWQTMRELDAAATAVKGTAFRAFKQVVGDLTEGQDFIVLDHQTHANLAAALHAAERLYRNSVSPVLLAPSAAYRVREAMNGLDAPRPRPAQPQ